MQIPGKEAELEERGVLVFAPGCSLCMHFFACIYTGTIVAGDTCTNPHADPG